MVDHVGPRRQPLVHRTRWQQDRDDQPDHSRHQPSFPSPTANSWPIGITAGPDGNLWFTEAASGKIGEINPTTHVISEFPTHFSDLIWPDHQFGPGWQPLVRESSREIGEINPTTHVITELSSQLTFPANSRDHGGPRRQSLVHRVLTHGQIGMINPTTHAITEFAIPSPVPGPTRSRRAPMATSGSPMMEPTILLRNAIIGMINPTTHAITEFPATPLRDRCVGRDHDGPGRQPLVHRQCRSSGDDQPDDPRHHGICLSPYRQHPLGITAGPDGNIWFADQTTASASNLNLTATSW